MNRKMKIVAFLVTGGLMFSTGGCLNNWFFRAIGTSLLFDGLTHVVPLNTTK